jgi:stress response protein YsnF
MGRRSLRADAVRAVGSGDSDRYVQLAVTKDMVKGAPSVDTDEHVGDSENDALYRYYDGYLGGSAQSVASGDGRDQGREYAGNTRENPGYQPGAEGRDTSGPTTDEAMTRSQERLHVGTEQAEAGRVRLRKHVVTENVTQTVPVSHEEARLEREPITDANRGDAMTGSDISEEEHEVAPPPIRQR